MQSIQQTFKTCADLLYYTSYNFMYNLKICTNYNFKTSTHVSIVLTNKYFGICVRRSYKLFMMQLVLCRAASSFIDAVTACLKMDRAMKQRSFFGAFCNCLSVVAVTRRVLSLHKD